MIFRNILEGINNFFKGDEEDGRVSINTVIILGSATISLTLGIIDVVEPSMPKLPEVPRFNFPSMGYAPHPLDDEYISTYFGG